jgi:hypothetical protein
MRNATGRQMVVTPLAGSQGDCPCGLESWQPVVKIARPSLVVVKLVVKTGFGDNEKVVNAWQLAIYGG